jgi:hypothetical protein
MSNAMTIEKLEELQAELSDLNAHDIDTAITDGASCETETDFVQNLDDAIEAAKLLLSELKAIRKQIKE